MRKILRISVMALFLFLWAIPAIASTFTQIFNPDAAYLSQTTNLNISSLTETSGYNSISDGTLTISFSSPVYKYTAGTDWNTWGLLSQYSGPPVPVLVSDNPANLYLEAQNRGYYIPNITMTFSKPLLTFGFEAESDIYDFYNMTANFYSGISLIGTASRTTYGNAGSRLFAASTDTPFTSVQFSISENYPNEGNSPFAIGALEYSAVPEPATLLLLGSGLVGLAGLRRKIRSA